MKHFYVINWNINRRKFEPYDVMPYLVNAYKESKKKLTTFKEFKEFVKNESQYQFWGRCEYEIILMDWPCQRNQEKWDIYNQIMMNIDTVTRLFMKSI